MLGIVNGSGSPNSTIAHCLNWSPFDVSHKVREAARYPRGLAVDKLLDAQYILKQLVHSREAPGGYLAGYATDHSAAEASFPCMASQFCSNAAGVS